MEPVLQLSPHSLLVVADSLTLSGNARLALFVLIGLLLVILGVLIAFAVLIRRHRSPDVVEEDIDTVMATPLEEVQEELVMMATSVATSARPASALAVASTNALTCPTCRKEFEAPLEFCPNDARRLVPASQLRAGAREGSSVCPTCRRGFDSGVNFCSHDATELIPAALDRARRRSGQRERVGVVAKICPDCNERYDLSVTFCVTDGEELVTLN